MPGSPPSSSAGTQKWGILRAIADYSLPCSFSLTVSDLDRRSAAPMAVLLQFGARVEWWERFRSGRRKSNPWQKSRRSWKSSEERARSFSCTRRTDGRFRTTRGGGILDGSLSGRPRADPRRVPAAGVGPGPRRLLRLLDPEGARSGRRHERGDPPPGPAGIARLRGIAGGAHPRRPLEPGGGNRRAGEGAAGDDDLGPSQRAGERRLSALDSQHHRRPPALDLQPQPRLR